MNRRELERWVADSRDRLSPRGIRVEFGFGPSVDAAGPSSWASFQSGRGSGRLIRAADGSSRVDVYAFADGGCLREERAAGTSLAQLDSIADMLAVRAPARSRA